MTEEPHNLILDFLRRFDTRLNRIEEGIRDVKFRVGSIETSVAHVSSKMDRFDERLSRIERRLDLVDA